MLISLGFMVLVEASEDASRSLSDVGQPSSVTTLANQKPVPGSKLLYTSFAIPSGDSATAFIIKSFLDVEKIMEGVSSNNDVEIKKRDPALRKIISMVLDLGTLGREALASHWDSLASKKKQRERYLEIFGRLIEENYMDKIRVYVGGNYKITLTGEKTNKRGTVVLATIKKKDADVLVEFQLRKVGDRWAVIDTRLDDTSLEEAYRGSFNRIIKKNGGLEKGFPELLRVMEKRLAELKKGKATKL